MTFSGAHSVTYRNEAGEVLGRGTQYDEPDYFECCGVTGRCVCNDLDDDVQQRVDYAPFGAGDPFNSMDGSV